MQSVEQASGRVCGRVVGVAVLAVLATALPGCSGPPPAEEPTGEEAEEALTIAVAEDPLERAVAGIYSLAMNSRDVPTVVEVRDAQPGELVAAFAEDGGDAEAAADAMVVAGTLDLARQLDPEGYQEQAVPSPKTTAAAAAPAPTAEDVLELVEDAVDGAEVLEPSAAVFAETLVVTTVTAVEEDIPRDSADAGDASVADACEHLAVGVREDLPAPEESLAAIYDCEPSSVTSGAEDELVQQVVSAELDAAVISSTHPGIDQHALVALDDADHAFPREQMAPVVDEAAADEIPDIVGQVSSRLDAGAVTTLRRLLSGEHGLSPREAAEYWLVEEELIAAPEDWG